MVCRANRAAHQTIWAGYLARQRMLDEAPVCALEYYDDLGQFATGLLRRDVIFAPGRVVSKVARSLSRYNLESMS